MNYNKISITDKIKNCPFCGGKANGYTIDNSSFSIMGICLEDCDSKSFIRCENCGALLSDTSQKNLLRIWNSRAEEKNTVRLMVPTLSGDYAEVEFSQGRSYQEVLDNAFKLAKKIGGMVVI